MADNRAVSTAQLVRNYLSATLEVDNIITTQKISKTLRRPVKDVQAEIARQIRHGVLAREDYAKGFRNYRFLGNTYYPKTIPRRPRRPLKVAKHFPAESYTEENPSSIEQICTNLLSVIEQIRGLTANLEYVLDDALLREVSRRLTS